eukprot:TRINITY_DN16234_c0_g1_i4.p1 TRINITY_DN16234_c0_g1~~TRINITY_DN16234_c0_g1_i4.p1  ORF type:complete len:310 (+),score=18.21 TRINITY_DN16234_c0_g1_i4:101-1030(+)
MLVDSPKWRGFGSFRAHRSFRGDLSCSPLYVCNYDGCLAGTFSYVVSCWRISSIEGVVAYTSFSLKTRQISDNVYHEDCQNTTGNCQHFIQSILQDPNELLLAMWLAVNRAAGPKSYWHTWIESIGSYPSNEGPIWAWDDPQAVNNFIKSQGLSQQYSQQLIEDAKLVKQIIAYQADEIERQYGKVASITCEDMLWALAQVHSRAFGAGEHLCFRPMFDLCNHDQFGFDGVSTYIAENQACLHYDIFSNESDDGQQIENYRDIEEGEELCIRYQTAYNPHLMLFMYGFVPTETKSAYMNKWPEFDLDEY